jgi:aspartate aminotransferase
MKPTAEMGAEFARRKARILALMGEIPGIEIAEPDGAFYIFPVVKAYFGKSDGKETIRDADDLCMYLLNTAHVSTVTGRAFGEPDCIRISFANSMEKIEKAVARIREALGKLK